MRLVRAVLVLLGAILLVPATASAASMPDRLPSWQLAPTGVTAQFRGLSAVSSRVATRRLVISTRVRFNCRYSTFLMSCPSGIGST